ncbi:hypothetical protein ABPG75_007082 [Micractinium tetrahymenae]
MISDVPSCLPVFHLSLVRLEPVWRHRQRGASSFRCGTRAYPCCYETEDRVLVLQKGYESQLALQNWPATAVSSDRRRCSLGCQHAIRSFALTDIRPLATSEEQQQRE